MNTDTIFSSLLGKFSILSILITGVGLLVNNLYLIQFEITDFNLIQPRSVLTGIMFCLFALFYVVVYTIKLDLKNIRYYTLKYVVGTVLYKYMLITTILFFVFDRNLEEDNKSLIIILTTIALSSPTYALISIVFYLDVDEKVKKNKWYMFPKKLGLWMSYLGTLAVFLFANYKYPSFRNFAASELLFLLFFVSYIAGYYIRSLPVMVDQSEVDSPPKESLFSIDGFDFNDKREQLFYIFYIVLIGFTFTKSYSSKIHSYLSITYGGGKPYEFCVETKDNQLFEGNLIYQDETKYYLQIENKIHFIMKNEVNYVLIGEK